VWSAPSPASFRTGVEHGRQAHGDDAARGRVPTRPAAEPQGARRCTAPPRGATR
jgi:hypothetical protein